jgi:hypothetical protein
LGSVLEQRAGDLGVVLQVRTDGIVLQSLADLARGQELLASNGPPLFHITLRHVGTKKESRLAADEGWRRVGSRQSETALALTWDEPKENGLEGLSVSATAEPDAANHALRWALQVHNKSTNWSTWRVTFPQVAIRDLGETAEVFFPRGPGEVQRGVWSRAFKYRGNYPSGWCSMQFMAAYPENQGASGLYVAVQDPFGSTKDLAVESDPPIRGLRIAFEHPSPDMGRAGNDFNLSGRAVWQLLRGDWFDAAQIYKTWVRNQARWWPELSGAGRSDTPLWMRRLNLWAQAGGAAADCVPALKQFQSFFAEGEEPVGFHWYNWHQIPFDNDYPHYFPARPDFAQGVADLEHSWVRTMPYINGRLWDTHDRGAEDFEFTRVALPAASKQENGRPYVESYGSKETNGEPVRLAVMCPTTALWQRTVHEIVLKLLKEVGTSAVYVDQIAAAPPTLCMDPSHRHPLGGGHWWNEGYWTMLERIRADKPPGTVLTTECNGEPFIRWLDGYLTWHWQYDGQVPAFPAIYGGAIQMFGRAYRGGPTKDLALRMKAAQQLTFGEQIGWIDPGVIRESANADFLKRVVGIRRRFAEFFYAGEMNRPPRLLGPIPRIRADWHWSGEWWVTSDAVLAGAWRRPEAKQFLVIFVNVGDQPVRFKPLLDLAAARVPAAPSECLLSSPGQGTNATLVADATFGAELTLEPEQILVFHW